MNMMRSLKQLTVCLAAILSICSVCSVQTSQVLAISETELTDDVARASGVFYSCNATISLGQISCLVALTDTGTVTIRTILQKQDSNGNWYDYNTGDPGQTYRGTLSAKHTYYCSMPSGGTYRCRYVATGTVNGVSTPRYGYSGVYYA